MIKKILTFNELMSVAQEAEEILGEQGTVDRFYDYYKMGLYVVKKIERLATGFYRGQGFEIIKQGKTWTHRIDGAMVVGFKTKTKAVEAAEKALGRDKLENMYAEYKRLKGSKA